MSSEMTELVRKWKFNLSLLGPDVARRVLESCISDVEALLARTEAGADDDKSAWCDVHKTHDQCPHTDLAVDESVRLRQLFAASQEQVRVLTEMVERGQKHHERMMKLLHPQDASGDAEDARRYRWARDHVGGTAWNDDNFATVTIGVKVPKSRGTCAFDVTAEMLDAAIDAAMQAKEAK